MFFRVFLVILSFSQIIKLTVEFECFKHHEHCYLDESRESIICKDFDDFKQLDLRCATNGNADYELKDILEDTKVDQYDETGLEITNLVLIPNRMLVLNGSLDLSRINYKFDDLLLKRIAGFELNVTNNPLLHLKHPVGLRLFNSSFSFYLNGKPLDNKLDCNENRFKDYFNLFTNVFFVSARYFVEFKSELCIYALRDLRLEVLGVKLDHANQLRLFSDKKQLDNFNITIDALFLYDSNIVLSHEFFNPQLFKNTKQLSFTDVKFNRSNDSYPFRSIESLRTISLAPFDFRADLNSDRLKWMYHLNDKFNIDKFNYNLLANKSITIYFFSNRQIKFDDKDFCDYAAFPHNHLIMPIFDSDADVYETCSCTLMWLIFKNKEFQMNIDQEMRTDMQICMDDENFYSRALRCDFDRRLSECNQMRNGSLAEKMTLATSYNNYIYELNDFFDRRKREFTKTSSSASKIEVASSHKQSTSSSSSIAFKWAKFQALLIAKVLISFFVWI